jgi:carbon storage regulator
MDRAEELDGLDMSWLVEGRHKGHGWPGLDVVRRASGGAGVGLCQGRNRMLVLSRQRDETIMIGDEIEITVVDIRGDKVRLGINAPSRIAVHRKEVYDSIRSENQRASQISRDDLSGIGPVMPATPATMLPTPISPGPLRDKPVVRAQVGPATLSRTGTSPTPIRRSTGEVTGP